MNDSFTWIWIRSVGSQGFVQPDVVDNGQDCGIGAVLAVPGLLHTPDACLVPGQGEVAEGQLVGTETRGAWVRRSQLPAVAGMGQPGEGRIGVVRGDAKSCGPI